MKSIQKYHTEWRIREKDYQKTILTDVFEIHIIELPKMRKSLKEGNISKDKLSIWVRFLINPENLEENEMNSNKDIKMAKEEIDKMKQSEYDNMIVELRMKYIMDSKWMKESAIEEGMEKGNLKAKTDMARKMLDKKIPIEEISEITELTIEQIEKIKNN